MSEEENIVSLSFPSREHHEPNNDIKFHQEKDCLLLGIEDQVGWASLRYFINGEQEGRLRDFLNRRFMSLSEPK